MRNVVGIIINSPNQSDLGELVSHRSIHTIPIGGKYRLIDFALSNMVNSGIKNIGVIGSYLYRSLVDHLGSGEEWNLSAKSNDLAILHGGRNVKIGEITRINLQDFIDNEAFFTKISKEVENFVICGCNIVYNFDLTEALDFHKKKEADITMVFKRDYQGQILNKEVIMQTEEGMVKEIIYSADKRTTDANVFVDTLVIKKEILLDILENVKKTGSIDLIDIIKDNLGALRVAGYYLNGYVKIINSIKSYFDCSMDMLNLDIQKELLHSDRKIYTKAKDNHPAKYNHNSEAKNALVASGTNIKGHIENSIIFREAKIEEGAKVKNCVIMQQCIIGENSVIVNAILDKYVKIGSNKILVGTEKEPLIIKKDSIV